MKKVLKIMGVVFLIFILLVVIGIVLLKKMAEKISAEQMVPENYQETTSTGGEIEALYLQNGEFDVSFSESAADEKLVKYLVYYPTELETSNKTYPVVIFANGTGVMGSRYKALFEHMASWGFVVVGNEDKESWSGISSDMSLSYILRENESKDSKFYNKIDTATIGISGHSQGGAGVFNAITECENSNMYKTAVSLSPTNEQQANELQWHYDLTKIDIPTLMIAGTEGDFETKLVIPYERMVSMYEKISLPKAMMRKKGCEHGEMLYSADGYVTAWFMWQLQGNTEAAKAFIGDAPEILDNELYMDIKIDISK